MRMICIYNNLIASAEVKEIAWDPLKKGNRGVFLGNLYWLC